MDQPETIFDLARHFPASGLPGCSTAEDILDSQVSDDALVVSVLQFAATRLQVVTTPIDTQEQPRSAGEILARSLPAEGLRAMPLLSDGLRVNGTRLVEGLRSVWHQRRLSPAVWPVTGTGFSAPG